MAAIVICDKIQSHDRISLVHNITVLHKSASVEASVIKVIAKDGPQTVKQ